MAWTTIITEQTLTVGERTFGPFTLATAIKGVHVRATRVNWSDTGSTVMSVSVDVSLDRGNTWINDFVGWSANGGSNSGLVKFGDLPNCTAGRFSIPTTGNNWRRIRIHLNVLTPITTAFAFEAY